MPPIRSAKETPMAVEKTLDEDHAIAEIAERLKKQFPQTSPQAVDEVVGHLRASFVTAKVRSFVPVLIEKAAKSRLTVAR